MKTLLILISLTVLISSNVFAYAWNCSGSANCSCIVASNNGTQPYGYPDIAYRAYGNTSIEAMQALIQGLSGSCARICAVYPNTTPEIELKDNTVCGEMTPAMF